MFLAKKTKKCSASFAAMDCYSVLSVAHNNRLNVQVCLAHSWNSHNRRRRNYYCI